jgi:acetyl-CoA synthetase
MSGNPSDQSTIEAYLHEDRHFEPSAEFKADAAVNDDSLYELAAKDRVAFWEQQAENLDWFQKWDKALEWNPPYAKWFTGGTLNASYNCLDRHVTGGLKNRAAIIWEGEPGDSRTLTYWDMYRDVNKFANCLKKLGVQKGDRVAVYMPMVPELVIAMLACARIGAVHSVVFGGFSPEALRDRINDSECKVLITADGGYRRGTILPLKHDADIALRDTPSIEHVVIVKRNDHPLPLHVIEGRDHWYHRLMQDAEPYCEPEPMDAEDMLYILYTSGTTGKPKGIIHTTGGYMTGCHYTTKYVFDLKPDDIFWCTADCGWVTGHSYITYGPMSNGATQVMYEGAPNWPDKDRLWEICAKYGVSVFYTAPTAIRAFMKWGDNLPKKHDLSTLRLLGSVGEPINPEAWMWYHEHIGNKSCPIVDTWWQTETGSIMASPLPGVTKLVPGSCTRPLPGIEMDILTEEGEHVEVGGGYLVIKSPWPSMLRGLYGDPERFEQTYWSKYKDTYFAGDGAKRDEEGYFWVLGRVDDVMNVSGHRISTMEVESALVDHKAVAESAVVGIPHDLKGQAIAAFVTLKEGFIMDEKMRDDLIKHVAQKIGAIAKPDKIIYSADLPKTRSGKIMRRLLRDIAEGKALGDTTTLADASVVEKLKKTYEEK